MLQRRRSPFPHLVAACALSLAACPAGSPWSNPAEALDASLELLEFDDWRSAETAARHALDHGLELPRRAEAWVALGIAQARLLRPLEAERSFAEAAALAPLGPAAAASVVECWTEAGQLERASAALQTAEEAYPGHAALWSGQRDRIEDRRRGPREEADLGDLGYVSVTD
ncbi:MAG: hypothetical protein ISR76_00160 [Planctomycetes bacterium]|nr:hypothetical protein [Planctomycetota bacterium]MBL7007383.1 hypothetical protein [Planctomycetota bacterium]